jgi:hypothetical protein
MRDPAYWNNMRCVGIAAMILISTMLMVWFI